MWVVLTASLIGIVFLTVQSASAGARLKLLEERELQIEAENRGLSTKLVELTSLTKIEQMSKQLGFIKPEETFYIKDNEPVAQLP